MNHKNWPWAVPPLDGGAVRLLCEEMNIHPLAAACLLRIGVETPMQARLFLQGGLPDLGDPLKMAGVLPAIERLALAAKLKEPVLVYGDYDVDGVTSTALLILALQRLGVPAHFYIPRRLEEGYGLCSTAVRDWALGGGRLIVTVDCGSNDFSVQQQALELGLDLIISDHHEVADGERVSLAFINPRQPGCLYPEKNLAGVGVAWTLVRALYGHLGLPDSESVPYLQLAAVGTIADVVPLLGENRIIVRHGLQLLNDSPLPGLAALSRQAGLRGTSLAAIQVAFALAPRLNAPGRLGDAVPSVELLLAPSEQEAGPLSRHLDECNRQRQLVEGKILEQARELAAERADDPALVLWHGDWHPGVVGIVAGRLAEEYKRPTVMIALDGEEGTGSARSVPGFDLVGCLGACGQHLIRYGGHREAAGLTIGAARLVEFRADFCSQAAQFCAESVQQHDVAAEISPEELSLELARELARLAPFGQGNPEPLFLANNLQVVQSRLVGSKGNHLQLRLRKGRQAFSAIRFGAGREAVIPAADGEVDCVFSLEENQWQGKASLSLRLRDLRLSPPPLPSGFDIFDHRGGNRESLLMRLAEAKRLFIWSNTGAAAQKLRQQLGGCSTVTHRGLNLPEGRYDALVIYHIPYDRAAFERVLKGLLFNGGLCCYLLFGPGDLGLNERIFAASLPDHEIMQKLARHNGGKPEEKFPFPLTRRLLERAEIILAEIGGNREPERSALEQSRTYREDMKILAHFRAYQEFWWKASRAQLVAYLNEPNSISLPEGVVKNEPGRAENTN